MHSRSWKSIVRQMLDSRPLKLLLLIFLGGIMAGTAAADVDILDLRRTADGAGMELIFASDAASYYEVWRAATPEGEWQLADMVLGTGAVQSWVDESTRGVAARYYQLVQQSQSDPADADADGIDDVYELTHDGMFPLIPSTALVSRITVGAQRIAAGALATAPHQTSVTVQTIPAAALPVSVWLTGGDGYNDPATSGSGQTSPARGAATLAGDGQTFIAGGDASGQQPLVIFTDADGRAELLLTSSNQVDEQCVVHARVGDATALTGSEAQSPPITFEIGAMAVVFPRTLVTGADTLAAVTRTYNGMPLDGHEIEIFVSQVRVGGAAHTTDWEHSGDLAPYAAVRPAAAPRHTDKNGQSTAAVLIHDGVGVAYVEVQAIDLQVY